MPSYPAPENTDWIEDAVEKTKAMSWVERSRAIDALCLDEAEQNVKASGPYEPVEDKYTRGRVLNLAAQYRAEFSIRGAYVPLEAAIQYDAVFCPERTTNAAKGGAPTSWEAADGGYVRTGWS